MNITIIGTGYVGLVTGTCFAEMGNKVTCVDNNLKKIKNLKKGILPIYEPGLEEMVTENQKRDTLAFSTDLEPALKNQEVCFIAVGIPMGEDGSADLQYVMAVAKEIGKYADHHVIVVDKSTVPVGTADRVREVIQNELDSRSVDITFDVVSNPEFLKEGAAIEDFMHPGLVATSLLLAHAA